MAPSLSPPRSDVLAGVRLATAFQPVIDLDSGDVVGSEALLRAERGGLAVPPVELLDAARARGTLAELDLAALGGAVAAAREAGSGMLLVNVEPSTLVARTNEVVEALDRGGPRLRIVVEVTERALAADPPGLLRATAALTTRGYPIALDDVGAMPQSLALLDLVRPAIVKLDMTLLRKSTDPANLHVAGAVAGYAEAVGAHIIAEGIETADDLVRARILGANLGQGWLWGRPGPTWADQDPAAALQFAAPSLPTQDRGADTPYSLLARHRPTRIASKGLLFPLSLAVEASATQAHLPAVLLATFQHARNVPASTHARFEEFARRLPVVGMFGESIAGLDIPGAHLGDLAPDDPLCREWNVVALGAQSAVALAAREVPGAPGRDRDRVFSFATTRDRALVVAAARTLVTRLGTAAQAARDHR